MGNIGESLKSAREARGITLDKAEEDTKIRKRYLQALEDGDYDVIPGRVYAKGFLRNYAKYLGLDQEEIMIEYKLLGTPVREGNNIKELEKNIYRRRLNNRSGRKAYLLTAMIALLAVIILAAYGFMVKNNPDSDSKQGQRPDTGQTGDRNPSDEGRGQAPEGQEPPGENPGENPAENPSGSAENRDGTNGNSGVVPGPDQQAPSAEGKVKVILNGKDQVCWASVTVDGRVIFTGNINPGESRSFGGERSVKVKLGNAGAVEVVVNGQNLGTLGGYGDVETREFTPETM